MSARCPCCGAPMLAGRARAAAIVGRMTFRNQQARILACLMRDFGRAVDTETILDAVYADHRDGGPLGAARSVAVAVVALRRRLKPFGLVIDGVARNGRTLRFANGSGGDDVFVDVEGRGDGRDLGSGRADAELLERGNAIGREPAAGAEGVGIEPVKAPDHRNHGDALGACAGDNHAPESEIAPGRYVGLVRHVDSDDDAPPGRRQAA